jgi:thiamine-monophosphate kinase
VTGTLGDAALGVDALRDGRHDPRAAYLIRRFRAPSPRLQAGRSLVESGIVSAMIDVSDGLVQDLGHICHESRVGAQIHGARLPLSEAYRAASRADNRLALQGGEDYELLCTVPERRVDLLERTQARLGCRITWIGVITAGRKVRILDPSGETLRLGTAGYDHFRSPA